MIFALLAGPLKAAFAWIGKSATNLLLAALAIALAWGFWGHRSADKWHKQADDTELARKADRAFYEAAQKLAGELAVKARDAQEQRSRQLAKEADNVRHEAYAASAADYSTRNRVRTCPAQGAAGSTVAAGQDHAAAGDNGPGADAVVLSLDDFEVLNGNTERLMTIHGWGNGLIADGSAVAGE